MNSLRTRFPLIVRAVMFVKGAYAGTVSTWVGGTSNAWTDASNRDNSVPLNTVGAQLSAVVNSTANNPVVLGSSLAVSSLTLGSGSALQIGGDSALTLAGPGTSSLGAGSSITGTLNNAATSAVNVVGNATLNGLVNQSGGLVQTVGATALALQGTAVNQSGAAAQNRRGGHVEPAVGRELHQ